MNWVEVTRKGDGAKIKAWFGPGGVVGITANPSGGTLLITADNDLTAVNESYDNLSAKLD